MKIFALLIFTGVNLYAGDLKQEVMDRINYIKGHNDHSHFSIHAGSFDQSVNDRHTRVHFIVTDSSGRKTGFKSTFTFPEGDLGVYSYHEIPNSSYGVSQTPSLDPSVVPDEPESAVLDFSPPIQRDTYTITFVAFENVRYFADIHLANTSGETFSALNEAYISSGTTQQYVIYLDPTPGAPSPAITKTVTFNTLCKDVSVAQKLNQLGDDKHVKSLIKTIDLAEKLSAVCDKRKRNKDKGCEPAAAVLKLFIKRLEKANRKCDSKDPKVCDEDKDWEDFGKEHRKDHDYHDFFREWDRGDWQKDKKISKRFVADEALKIIKEDANWLIKSLGGEMDKGHGENNSDRDNGHGGKADKKDKN